MAILAPTYTDFLVYDSGKSSYWDTVTTTTGTSRTALDPNVVKGSVVQVQFNRTEPAGVRENVALFDLHLSTNAGLGAAWSPLSTTTIASVETALDAFWTTLKVRHTPHWLLGGYVWRHFGADYPLGTTGLSKPSPIFRTTTRSVAGTSVAAAYTPDQLAQTVTFRTASRRHWGRSYMPAADATQVDQYGRLTNGYCDALAGAFDTFFSTINGLAAETHAVVWSSKYRGFFSVRQLAVDNVPDVIRRRRAYAKSYTKTYG